MSNQPNAGRPFPGTFTPSAPQQPQPARRSPIATFFMTIVLFLLFLAAGIAVVGVFFLEGKYDVAREVTIHASPEAVHKQVGDLAQWPNWLPFTKHDDTIKTTIVKPTGVGANQHWTGKSGAGKLTFTVCDEQKGIEFDMLFDEKYASKGSMTYAKAGNDTKVTWRMTGQNDDFLGKWMAVAMPYMMPSMFDEGLADLKKKVEGK